MFKIENMTQEEVDDLVYERDYLFEQKQELKRQLQIKNEQLIELDKQKYKSDKYLKYAIDMLNGEYVDTDKIEKLLGINFSEGLKRFDFSRTVEWNSAPLNGQKITTKFKLKPTPAETELKYEQKIQDEKRWAYEDGSRSMRIEYRDILQARIEEFNYIGQFTDEEAEKFNKLNKAVYAEIKGDNQ